MRLAARGVTFRYRDTIPALQGVDLELLPGQVLAVCGPNGSGKSTLLKVLGGLLTPAAGAVTLDGRPLDELPLQRRAQLIARVPQELPALPDLAVTRFVLAGRYARIDRWRGPTRKDWQAVEWALEAADVADLAGRTMAELSGGQRQRILLARALAQEAAVLLIDEPTSALDPEHQVAVFDMIAELGSHGRSALVVTHDLNLAGQFASEIALLDEGRLVGQGPPDEVLRPAALEPVYGGRLHYGTLPDGRPFVVPWRGAGEG